MTEETILPRVTEILEEKFEWNGPVTPEAILVSQLDSLDQIEFTMALEDEFSVYLTDDDIEEMETVADAVRVIRAKTSI